MKMNKFLCGVLMLCCMTTAHAQTNTSPQIQAIRDAYTKAKQMIEQKKQGEAPLRSMTLTFNEVLSEEHNITRTTEVTFHYDLIEVEEDVDADMGPYRLYFVTEHVKDDQSEVFREILYDDVDSKHVFTYARYELESGNVYETRFYWDNDDNIILQKGEDAGDDNYEHLLAAKYRVVFNTMVNSNI